MCSELLFPTFSYYPFILEPKEKTINELKYLWEVLAL